MEYIHKQTQQIISLERYRTLSKKEQNDYQKYYGEDADHGTGAVKNQQEDEDEDDDDLSFQHRLSEALDFSIDSGIATSDDSDISNDDSSSNDFGGFDGGDGGGAGASGDF